MILPGFPDLVSEVETIGAPAHRPFHVLSNAGSRSRWARPGPQYLKRSMKCCGDTGVKQLSGSAAVQGWPESCGRGRALPHVPGGKTAQKSPGIHLNAPGPHRTGMRTARIRDTWLLSGESPRASAWGTGRPSLGAGRSPRFPAPQPRPRPGHAAPLRPRWARIHSGTVPGTTHPRSPEGPAPCPPAETPRARLCQNSLGTWGPVRPVSGDRTPPQPSLHPPSGLKAARGTPMVAK